jgi:ABC-type polysaccharide/polyol phosphate transport system ATPase subunit
MVMVAHDLDTIRTMCTRVMWMTQGRVVMAGDPDAVVSAYVSAATATAA